MMPPRPLSRPLSPILTALRRIVAFRSIPEIRRHRVRLANWRGPAFSIAVLSDLHVVAPWTRLGDLRRAVARINALSPDIVVLGGDYLAEAKIPGRRADAAQIVSALSGLGAPLGVFAILGNHDWKDCPLARDSGYAKTSLGEAFERSAITLLQNDARRLELAGHELWLVGIDSQRSMPTAPAKPLHDPEAAFSGVPPGAPAILLAHEPDYFATGDRRAGLQISGHTHGGQLNLFGWRPIVPSRFGARYAWGRIREHGRDLVVSGGIGFSGFPMRIGQPPEITLVSVEGAPDAT